MQLLVSVADATEASAAVRGGADVIDAKDAKNPQAGALGAVSPGVLREIREAVATRRPVTAAVGDATDERAIERIAFEYSAGGAAFVKVGFAGIGSEARVARLSAAAWHGVAAGGKGKSGLVIVGYADADRAASVEPGALVEIAARAGARGVLLDTADKVGPGLRALIDLRALTAWVALAHDSGLFVALAGKLTADELPFVRDAGADIAGVRGAACDGGRAGRVSADRVRLLRAACVTRAPAAPTATGRGDQLERLSP
jgi:uncharacterized protein (UPF0264 family)